MKQHSHFEETGNSGQMSDEEMKVALKRELDPHFEEIEKIFSGQMPHEEKAVALKRVFAQIPEENIGSCFKLFFDQMSKEQIGKCMRNYFEHLSKENLADLNKRSTKATWNNSCNSKRLKKS